MFLALVGPLGTDLDGVSGVLRECLSEVSYDTSVIRLIEALTETAKWRNLPAHPIDRKYESRMDAGNAFREKARSGDALALLAISSIRQHRKKLAADPDRPAPRHAYVLRSLKHPKEARTLRGIYGDAFFLLAVHSPRDARVQNLARQIAESHHVFQINPYLSKAEELIERDEAESGKKLGQNVRDTFPLADVFIDGSDPAALKGATRRFIELLFGYPFHTPTREEYGMFHAKAGALRSSDLSRQVGAAVLNQEGDIVAIGTNEVPKPGGGPYWPGDASDHRDFTLGYETSDRMRRGALADVLTRLKAGGWLSSQLASKRIEELVRAALSGPQPLMRGSQLMSIIEFGRAVHAEMAAITDAARRGVSVRNCTLYSSTFPCHVCARHIVGAGLQRVVYIEPYPKSLVPQLYPDSIVIDRRSTGDAVRFEPFAGVAPRRYLSLFEMVQRKDERRGGRIVVWNKASARPRLAEPLSLYQTGEQAAVAALSHLIEREPSLAPVKPSGRQPKRRRASGYSQS